MRQIAVASALTMVAIAIGDAHHAAFVVVAFAVGAVVTVTDNGLGFTAAAEIAGSAWAGRALGAQNTAQNIAAILTPPLLGVLIESTSYSTGFLVAAIFPVDRRRAHAVRSATSSVAYKSNHREWNTDNHDTGTREPHRGTCVI